MLVATNWSSLEITKLVVSALTPILLFVLGYMVTKASRRVEEAQRDAARRVEEAQRDAARRFEEAQWASRKLIESRLALFEEMAPKLNDLFSCFMLVGQFREVTPPEALSRKRELDRIFHSHAPLFSPEFRTDIRTSLTSAFSFSGARPSQRGYAHRWLLRNGSGRLGSLSGTRCLPREKKARLIRLRMRMTT